MNRKSIGLYNVCNRGLESKGSILIVLFFFVSCSSKIVKDPSIFFFNINGYNRTEISEHIHKIDSFGPRLICLSSLFEFGMDHDGDFLLAQAIKNSKKVILAAYINPQTGQINRSHAEFIKHAKNEGVISFLLDDEDLTVSHIPLYQDSLMQMMSYANVIAFNYLITENNRITRFDVNREEKIEFSKGLNDFFMLDESQVYSTLVKDKIALLGNFGPEQMDTYFIKVRGIRMSVPLDVVNANVIQNIVSSSK